MTKLIANIPSIEVKTCIEDTVVKAKYSVQELQKSQTKNESNIWNNLWHVEKMITHKATISLCDILYPWNHILCALKVQTSNMASYSLWTLVLEKLRTIQLVPVIEENSLCWTLFCTDCGCSIIRSEVHPRDLKDLLHLLPELVNQHYMTSVCFIDN